MSYGLKLYNTAGESKTITPDDATVIASGSLAMSDSLESGGAYGENVLLDNTYDENQLSVLVVPGRPNYNVTYSRYISGTLYYNTFYLDDAETYYTRNTTTGAMTSFSAGNQTANNKSTWNPVLSVFPIAFWDKMGASTFSSIRLFAATCYLIRDPNNDTNFSLAGSASGSGGQNSPNNIKDNNTSTWYGQGCYVSFGNSCSWSYSAQVSFASKTITKTEMYHAPLSQISGGNYANGTYTVSLYYSGGWHSIFTSSWSGNYAPGPHTTNKTGHWKGVTIIRIVASGSAQANGGINTGSEHVTFELRAWGAGSSDDSENKIVYSIGSKGITTVDYMICRKRFTS